MVSFNAVDVIPENQATGKAGEVVAAHLAYTAGTRIKHFADVGKMLDRRISRLFTRRHCPINRLFDRHYWPYPNSGRKSRAPVFRAVGVCPLQIFKTLVGKKGRVFRHEFLQIDTRVLTCVGQSASRPSGTPRSFRGSGFRLLHQSSPCLCRRWNVIAKSGPFSHIKAALIASGARTRPWRGSTRQNKRNELPPA
ncbi:MAG: hypothetical protein LBI87_13655 [Candidatus Accumulibacter sp.]|jgi:hypothetical protein|nr:hypothetical protein [Accumulibacter sp.]